MKSKIGLILFVSCLAFIAIPVAADAAGKTIQIGANINVATFNQRHESTGRGSCSDVVRAEVTNVISVAAAYMAQQERAG